MKTSTTNTQKKKAERKKDCCVCSCEVLVNYREVRGFVFACVSVQHTDKGISGSLRVSIPLFPPSCAVKEQHDAATLPRRRCRRRPLGDLSGLGCGLPLLKAGRSLI